MSTETGKSGFVKSFLKIVERGGNALPHPATIFLLLALLVIAISGLADWLGWMADRPGKPGEVILPRNLFSKEGLHYMMTSMVTNFTGFAPLGTVLVAMLGIGIAESSGLIGTGLRLLVTKSPKNLLTFVIVMAGVLSNAASEVGYVLLVPLGGVIFLAAGRHPIAGLAAAFAGVSGGYSANLILGTVDPLLAGLTQEAVRGLSDLGPFYANYEVNPACNIYFMIASTPLIAALGTLVTEYIVVPMLGPYKGDAKAEEVRGLTAPEKLGLHAAVGSGIVFMMILMVSIFPTAEMLPTGAGDGKSTISAFWWQFIRIASCIVFSGGGLYLAIKRKRWFLLLIPAAVLFSLYCFDLLPGAGFMRHASGALLGSPFMKSIVAIIFLVGAVMGIAYGFAVKAFKNDSDVMAGMGKTLETLGVYMVLVFFAAQFVAYFSWTNLGTISAVKGAEFLQAMDLPGPVLMICFVIVAALFNLFMGSASAKWGLMAPIFVPMFMFLGYSPEFTQVVYRIGDSVTNIISPCMSYFALIVAFIQKYDKKGGIGTVIATMMPYSLVFFIGWVIMLVIWMMLGVPPGPGADIHVPINP